MRTRVFALVGARMLLSLCVSANGQTASGKKVLPTIEMSRDADDEKALLEVGTSTNWNFSGGAATFAPTWRRNALPSSTGLN